MGYSVIKSLVIKPKDLYIKLSSKYINYTPAEDSTWNETYNNLQEFNDHVDSIILDIFAWNLRVTTANQYKWYLRYVEIKEYLQTLISSTDSSQIDFYDTVKQAMHEPKIEYQIRNIFLYGNRKEKEKKAQGNTFWIVLKEVDSKNNQVPQGFSFLDNIHQSKGVLTGIQESGNVNYKSYAKCVYLKDRVDNEFVVGNGNKLISSIMSKEDVD